MTVDAHSHSAIVLAFIAQWILNLLLALTIKIFVFCPGVYYGFSMIL
jgi:hypothetical protein